MTRLYADGRCIATIPDEDDYDPPAYISARCQNCGAPLEPGQIKCDYCNSSRKLKERDE